MEVRILGPLEVQGDSGPLLVTTPKERAVLEVLALHGGDVVSTDSLIDALWGFHPPRSAAKSLQSHISRLRRTLPADAIATEGSGYRLTVAPEDVDAHRFERLVAAGRQAADGGDHRRAIQLLDRALDLWRGTPLADLAEGALRTGQTVRLDQLRLASAEARVDAHLALGHQQAMVAETEALVADHPLRERFWAQLMLSLYRSDRRADALAVFQRLRGVLREELGIDPSKEVRELEGRILREDPDLVLLSSGPPSSIPTPLTSFVGRDRQRREVGTLLREGRLTTLLGPGGVGKTRLAIAVAGEALPEFAGGCWWVDATHAAAAGAVAAELATVIGVAVPPGMAVVDAVERYLSSRTVLVVVDNAERIAADLGRWLGDLLEVAPGLTALVTSRVPLKVMGEQRYPVPPMELPGDDVGTAHEAEAMWLFIDRLAARGDRDPDCADVEALADLCRMVDGLPLGIELLVPRVSAVGPIEVRAELQDHLELPAGGFVAGDDRHASLDLVLASTIELLEPTARELFGRLSVFRGSFDRAAMRAVGGRRCDPDDLAALVDAALVGPVGVEHAMRRYRLLETTQAYAAAHGNEEDLEDAAAHHAEFFRNLCRRAGRAMEGPDEQEWVDRLRPDDENIKVALRWWGVHDPPGVLAFVRGLGRAWYVWGDLADTRDRLVELQRLVEPYEASLDPEEIGWLHLRSAWPLFLTGDIVGGMAEMAAAADRFGDVDQRIGLAHAHAGQGQMVLFVEGPTDAALRFYRQAVDESRRCGSAETVAWILAQAAQALVLADRVDADVERMLDEAQPVLEASGDLVGQAHVCMDRMFVAYARDDPESVREWSERGIECSRAAGHAVYEQVLVTALGVWWVLEGDHGRSGELLERSARIALDSHNLYQLGITFQALAVRAAIMGRPVVSARLWGTAGALVPVWPLFERRYFDELMVPAREILGERWDDEVAAGSALTVDEALELGLQPSHNHEGGS